MKKRVIAMMEQWRMSGGLLPAVIFEFDAQKLERFQQSFVEGGGLSFGSVVFGLLLFSLALVVIRYVDRWNRFRKVREFLAVLEFWPDVSDEQIAQLIMLAAGINPDQLSQYGASKILIKKYGSFMERYSYAVVHPYIYKRRKLLKHVAYLTEGVEVFVCIGDHEYLVPVQQRHVDSIVVPIPDTAVTAGMKIKLTMLSQGKNLQFRGKIADVARGKLRLYAYRNLDRRHYVRMEIANAFLTIPELEYTLEIIDFSSKYIRCKVPHAFSDAAHAAEFRFSSFAKAIDGFSVKPFSARDDETVVFVITKIRKDSREALIHFIFQLQQRR